MAQFWLPGDSDFALAMREPNLLLPRKKPIGDVVVDKTHPLGDVFISALFRGGNERWFGSCTERPSLVSGDLQLFGDYVQRSSTSVYYDGVTWPSYEATVLIRTNSPVSGNNYVSEWNGYSPGLTNSTTYGGYYFTGGGKWSDIFPENTVPVTFVWRFRYTGGTYYAEAWKDRVKSATTYNDNFALNGKSFRLLGGFSKPTTDQFFYAHAWTRALPDAQIALLYDDELGFYKPANDTPFLISVPAGGGTPTLSSPSVINVLSDRATPQVTLTF